MEIAFLIGRILLGGFFVYNAYNHLIGLEGTSGYAQMKGIPMPKIATAVTGLMLLVGGLSIAAGVYPLYGIYVLLAFMVPMTLVMHQFWAVTDPMQKMTEKVQFSKNVAIIGALISLIPLATLAWPLSIVF
jgi:putative oxidoreductase